MVCICYFTDVNYYNFNKQTIACITTEVRYTVSEQAEGKDLCKKGKQNRLFIMARQGGVQTEYKDQTRWGKDRNGGVRIREQTDGQK